MKVALYVEDGLEQVVLTPETETECGIVGKLHDGTRSLEVYRGEFYACRGGWVRHRESLHGTVSDDDKSTILVLRRRRGVKAHMEAERQGAAGVDQDDGEYGRG